MRNKLLFLTSYLVVIFLLLPHSFASSISVGNVIVDFNKDKQRNYIDVSVSNKSADDETAYVKVSVYEIKNPGTINEQKVLVSKNDRNSIIVSPQKLIIPPHSKKNIRFIALHKNHDQDKVYRVNIAPVSGGKKIDKGQLIQILIAYDILVFVRPQNEDSQFKGKRNGKEITFENTGNTNILLRKAKQCSKDDPSECKDLAGKRLYANAPKYTQELPYDNEVEYTYSIGDKIHSKIYQ
jgi:P pilus assembly chaperone PapD